MKGNCLLIAILFMLVFPLLSFANNVSDISVDFDISQDLETCEVTVKIKNNSNIELFLKHPNQRYALSFIVMNDYGNLIKPVGIAKVDPKYQSITLKPRQVFECSISKQFFNLAKEKELNLPFLTGTALFGYPLGKGKTYRIIVVYRPYGKDKDGICSKEKIIKFK